MYRQTRKETDSETDKETDENEYIMDKGYIFLRVKTTYILQLIKK